MTRLITSRLRPPTTVVRPGTKTVSSLPRPPRSTSPYPPRPWPEPLVPRPPIPSAFPPPPAPVPRVPRPPTPYASPRPAVPRVPPREWLMPLPSPPGPSTAAPPPPTPVRPSAASRPSFLIFARSLAFLFGSTSGTPLRDGAASFFFASRLPSLPSSPLLFSPSLAPESSLGLGGSTFSGGGLG